MGYNNTDLEKATKKLLVRKNWEEETFERKFAEVLTWVGVHPPKKVNDRSAALIVKVAKAAASLVKEANELAVMSVIVEAVEGRSPATISAFAAVEEINEWAEGSLAKFGFAAA
jgi:hypothetical protein